MLEGELPGRLRGRGGPVRARYVQATLTALKLRPQFSRVGRAWAAASKSARRVGEADQGA
eukprot:4164247-Pyramimonas_sp.AAC.1